MTTALTLRRDEQEVARAAAGDVWRQFYDEQGQEIALVFTGRYGTRIDPRRSIARSPLGATPPASDA